MADSRIEQFLHVVRAGDLAQARVLLATWPDLVGMDTSGGDERQALHFAVLRRDVAMVRLLMEAGANARKGVYPHREATTAMALAEARGFADVVAVIEEEEQQRRREMSCPNATVTPVQDRISAAIREGSSTEARALLEADPSLIQACDREGATPLHRAAQAADGELLTWLLQRRAAVNKEDVRGLTPLDWATLGVAGEAFAPLAELLLAAGARLTLRAAVALGREAAVRELLAEQPGAVREMGPGGGLLTMAVRHRQAAMIPLLLQLGADVDEREMLRELEEPTPSWGGPLWLASRRCDFEMTKLLLDHGADPNANVYASGWPLLNAWNDEPVKQLLLERGARMQPYMIGQFHAVDEARRLLASDPGEAVVAELLDAAADYGCPEIVEMALARLDWPRQDAKWRWYLIQPIRGIGGEQSNHEGHFRCMELLLRHGIDPNVAAFGQTALHFTAARHGEVNEAERARFAAMLLDYGARLDLRDEMLQSTPLGWACRWGRSEMIDVLLARGAPVHESDAEPWATPIAWAERRGHDGIAATLRARALSS
jgi:ankyrin repeat protein